MTLFQPEPSAQAPCTRTTVGFTFGWEEDAAAPPPGQGQGEQRRQQRDDGHEASSRA